MHRPETKLANSRSQVGALTTTPPSQQNTAAGTTCATTTTTGITATATDNTNIFGFCFQLVLQRLCICTLCVVLWCFIICF